MSNIIKNYPNVFIKLYNSNFNIKKFITKNITKFMYILNVKKINIVLNQFIHLNNNYIYTLDNQNLKKISEKQNLDLIEIQKNIATDNKIHFLNMIKTIALKIDNKYICNYLENKNNNLNNYELVSLLNFTTQNNIQINHSLIFDNLLSKGKTKILKYFIENYEINKIPFDFVCKKILNYSELSWSQKYNIRYCIHFLLDNNLLQNPNDSNCQNILIFFNSEKIKNKNEYNFTPYWENHVFQKLWIFLLNTNFIEFIIKKFLKNISEEDLIEEKECPICYCSVNNKDIKLECNHYFHKECICNYYKNKNYNNFNSLEDEHQPITLDCPYCRKIMLEI